MCARLTVKPLLKLVGRMQMLQSQIAAQQAATQVAEAPSDPVLVFDEAIEEEVARAEGEEGEEDDEDDGEEDDDDDEEDDDDDEMGGDDDEDLFDMGGDDDEEDYDDDDFGL